MYAIECTTCRNQGTHRVSWGESSRSSYQRGCEHQRYIDSGLMSHPLVIHFWEEHDGQQQQIIMIVVSKHVTALDRQVTESVRINTDMKTEDKCLNLKSEWGGSKIPNVNVNNPKGTASLQQKCGITGHTRNKGQALEGKSGRGNPPPQGNK